MSGYAKSYPHAVRYSHGGQIVGHYSTKVAAIKAAKRAAKSGPVDLWSTSGGSFGMGKVLEHFASASKNTSTIRVHSNPSHKQFRIVNRNYGPYIPDGSAGVMYSSDSPATILRYWDGILRSTKVRTAELQSWNGDGYRKVSASEVEREQTIQVRPNPDGTVKVQMKKVGDHYSVYIGGAKVNTFDSKADAEKYGKHLIKQRGLFVKDRTPQKWSGVTARMQRDGTFGS